MQLQLIFLSRIHKSLSNLFVAMGQCCQCYYNEIICISINNRPTLLTESKKNIYNILQFCKKSVLFVECCKQSYIVVIVIVVIIHILIAIFIIFIQGLKLCILIYYWLASNETANIHTLYFRDSRRYVCL